MFMVPVKIMFFMFMGTGIAITISASTWFGVWMGLELNVLSFLPLMAMDKNESATEGALKYFLIQASASLVLLLSGLYMWELNWACAFMLTSSLLMKMGVAPLHFWFPMVAESLTWWKFSILSTVQKVAPAMVLYYSLSLTLQGLLIMAILASALTGALGGINELLLRKLLSFSSINHMSWILWGMLDKTLIWMSYFLLYCFLLVIMVMLLAQAQVFHLNQILNPGLSKWTMLTMGLSLLSLGGVPPLLGFYPKWILLQATMMWQMMLIGVWLIFMSLVILYYYIRLALTILMMLNSPKVKYFLPQRMNTETILISMNSFGLFITSGIWVSPLHSLLS